MTDEDFIDDGAELTPPEDYRMEEATKGMSTLQRLYFEMEFYDAKVLTGGDFDAVKFKETWNGEEYEDE